MGKSTEMQQLGEVMHFFKSALKEYYTENELDSITSAVFMHVLKLNRIDLHVRTEQLIKATEFTLIKKFVADLQLYKPLQYLIGEVEFYNFHLEVNEHVLIPRPETEELVQWVIENETISQSELNILDIGTGSGCIAIALAKNIQKSSVYAIDISDKALALAKKNAEKNKVNIQFDKIDLLQMKHSKLPYLLDVIVSNPPYVTESEKALILPNVIEHEPHEALFVPDDDALIYYKAIRDFALINLKPQGKIYLEINEKYGKQCAELYEGKGFDMIELKKDINGKHRMLKVKKTIVNGI